MLGIEKKTKRFLGLLLTILINIAIVAYIASREFGGNGEHFPTPASLNISLIYLLLAAACFVLALLMETFKYSSMIIASEGRYDPKGAFECAALGKYYDNITPLGAGGQPFQIFYLKKRGFSTGSSAALPIVGFLGLKLAFVLLAVFVFVFNSSISQGLPAMRVGAYIGLAFYLFLPLCVVLFAMIPNPFSKIVCIFARFLNKLHIVKDYDKAVNDIISYLGKYTESLKAISSHPHLLLKVIFFSTIYQLAILSMPYFVLRAFGGANSWWTVFSLVVYIYAAITIIPTPGNAGAAEGFFYTVFSTLTSANLFWAVLIWRLLCYYTWLILGLIILTKSAVKTEYRSKKRKIPKEPLRVAQFMDIYYPSIDGVIVTVNAYAKRMNKTGYCCVIAPRPSAPYEDSPEYDVLRTAAIRFPGINYLLPTPMFSPKLHRFMKSREFDVFHVHSPFFEGSYAVRLGRKLGIPVVATFHSKYYEDVLSITHSRFLAHMVTNHIVKFYSKVDEVWACSECTAATLRSYGFHGDIKVMENGTDIIEFPDPDALRRRAAESFNLPEDKRILLFVGQQIWQKNLRLVLDTTKLLKDSGEDCVTVIAGQGYNAEAIKKYAASLNLGDSVLFTGVITDRNLLYGLFLSANLFFFPSLYDNAPLVLREAALMGLPALLSAGSNSAEQIRDECNGYTEVPDAKKMAEKIKTVFALSDINRVGQNAKGTIPISWDTIVSRVMDRYLTAQKCCYTHVNLKNMTNK